MDRSAYFPYDTGNENARKNIPDNFINYTGSWIWNCNLILNFAGPQAVIWDFNLYAALKK